MRFLRGVDRTNVAAISACVMIAVTGFAGCGGGSSTSPAPTVSVALTPATATVQANQGASFTATVLNDPKNDGTTWTLSGPGCTGAACGSLSGSKAASGAAVMYTAPAAVPNPPTVTLTATSVEDTTKSAKATIMLAAAPPPPAALSVSVTPGTASLATGAVTQTFTANVTDDSQNLGVTWSISGTNCTGAACGSISPTTSASGAAVTYTSAARATSTGTVTVTAAAVAEASAFGRATVTLTAPAPPTIGATEIIAPVAVDAGFGVPAIATDSVGNIDFAWMGFDGIHVTRSTDGGATFSRDVLVPSDLSLNVQDNLLNMVVDPVGNIDLLWYRDVDGTATNISFLISRSSDNGATFTPPLQFTTNVFPLPQIVGRPDGKLIVTWVDSSSNLVAETTTDGVTLSAPITIAATIPGVAGEQAVVGPNGDVYVFWETGNGTNCSISFSSSADAMTYTAAKTISGGSGTCNSQPSVSVDLTGDLDVTWVADTTNLFFTRSVDGGTNFSTPINIATPAGPADDKVIAAPDGGIYVLWTAGGGTTFASSQNSGSSFTTNATPLGVSFNGDPPTFSVDACGNVTVFGGSGHVDSTYQRSNDGGITFEPPVDISGPPHQDFEQQIAMDKSGNVNFAWAIDGPSSVDFARLPTVCHVQ